MKDWLKKLSVIKKASSYVFIGLVVFLIGLVFHFPIEKLSTLATNQIQKQTGLSIEPEEVSFSLPLGIKAEKVLIRGLLIMGEKKNIFVDELTLNVSPLSIVTYPMKKTGSASFSATYKKSNIEGSAKLGTKTLSLALQAEKFRINEVFPLGGIDPMLTGSEIAIKSTFDISVTLEGDMTSISQGNFSQADGTAQITSTKMDVNAPFAGQLDLDQLKIDASLEKGKLDLKSASLFGPKIEAKANGEVRIAPYFQGSRMKLELRIKADPNDPQLGSLMPMIASMNGLRIDSTGSLNMTITGAFNDPTRISVKGF